MDINCKVCFSKTDFKFKTYLLKKHYVSYYQCSNCNFVQTEKPYWLEEAYSNSMNLTDTGIIHRNLISSRVCSSIISLIFKKKGKFLDYAGGYGVFTRLMRDKGYDFYWTDPYTNNLLARGFENQVANKYELVTTFESFEHFAEPLDELEKILNISKNIFFSTELLPSPLPKPDEWWYYGLEHGQHIALHTNKSLQFLAKKHNINFYSLGNLHLFTEKKLNILYKMLFKFKYGKHFLYILSYFILPFNKSLTFSDMLKLR